jgi:anti-anti-sigma regulatory factor
MPACSLEREVNGSTALYRISGKFDGASASDLAGRLEREALAEAVVDFSQVDEFMDSGVPVIANALKATAQKRIHLRGLRQHQGRLFRYFGVEVA